MKNFSKYILPVLLLLGLSCSNDDTTGSTDSATVIGTWELSRIENADLGTRLPPDDGRPVRINFMQGGTYDGVAGNNEVLGEYGIEADTLVMTLATTEVSNTDWERLFKDSLAQAQSQDGFVLPYTLTPTGLVLQYDARGRLVFIRI